MSSSYVFRALNIDNKPYYIGHTESEGFYLVEKEAYERALAEGHPETAPKKLTDLANLMSQGLHEDWKQNLISERGVDYQHFRPVKDNKFTEHVLANRDIYLNLTPELYCELTGIDRKELKPEDMVPLFKIEPKQRKVKKQQPDGTTKEIVEDYEEVQFDLIRVQFKHLTQKWKDANLEAAKFAIALIKTALPQGALQGDPQKVYEDLEKMSHDVHIEWMQREASWADPRLYVPYELLGVDEQNKDTDQIMTVLQGLSFRSNIFDRNRDIVKRALKAVLEEFVDDEGLKQEILENIEKTKPIAAEKDAEITQRTAAFKQVIKAEVIRVLRGKKSFTFDDLEKISAIYYNEWRKQARTVMKLPPEYDASYENHQVEDERLNFKNVARLEMADLVRELVEKGLIPETMLAGVNDMENPKSEIAKRIAGKNEEDFANYQAMIKGNVKPE